MRSWIASVVAAVLVATLLLVIQPPTPAAAAGPSVGLPTTPSVPVTPESMGARPADQASVDALSGPQTAGSRDPQGGGTPTATSLSPSATWSVSAQAGDFSWSYPLRVPPVPGGVAPNLALSYQSSTVDGRTNATNNQPSWVGDGWDLNVGFVERTYGSCAQDKEGGTTPPSTVGDLCWRSNNATASYAGGGGMLICCNSDGKWRTKSDDGSRVEKLGGAGNGARDGEYWKITTVAGVQYFFGSRPAAKSTWTVPVFGDDAGEPCHSTAGFGASSCTQAWRWNLDKLVDANGNTMLFGYETETNAYGLNGGDAAVSYIRGGWLAGIDYGLHATASSAPAARVVFAVADRCVPGSACTLEKKEDWPDTPLDERCVAATCPDKHSPTFWSTKRLASVTTQVRRDGALADVDRWSFEQQYPKPGDGEESAALWLRSITHTGLVGGQASLPPVTFEGHPLPNRVYEEDHLSPLLRYRITGVVSESGGLISVKYAEPNCKPGTSMPANAHTNTHRCFPVRWSRPGQAERTDWFHKYVVETVTLADRISSDTDQLFTYEYPDGAAWHYDTSEFTPDDKRTWNEFRGFGRVRVRQGKPGDPAGPITMSEQRFYRGMNRDREAPAGGARSVVVEDSEGGRYTDHDWLHGLQAESVTFLGDSATVVSKTLTEPVWRGPTASRDAFHAYQVRPAVERTFTTLEGGRRETKVVTEYDDRGQPTEVNDLGDVAAPADDLCTRATYVRNTAAWLLSSPSRVQAVSVHCDAQPSFPADAVADQYTSYDGQGRDGAPQKGNPTKVEVLDRFDGATPVYGLQMTTAYDVHGRSVEVGDALGRKTRTAHTPAEGGPTTKTVATNPLGFTTTRLLEPATGQPVTVTDVNGRRSDTAYDPLGRVVSVWTPDRPRDANFQPTQRFSYLIRRDAPTVVTNTRIGANGNYITSHQLHDGLLRVRQVQAPAVGGGRLLIDTRYDSQGRAYKATEPYFNDAPVDDKLWRASDVEVPGLTETKYDGAGRPVESIFKGGAVAKWRTVTRYGGDRIYTTPPAGGTPTLTIQDARGRAVEQHQYRGDSPSGPSEVTRYAYDPTGQLTKVTDAAGNTWQYRYDLRGRRVWADHPDQGQASYSYDAAGQLVATTDARGQRLDYTYDALGRSLTLHSGGDHRRLMAKWTYDTVPDGLGGVVKGHAATTTSYDLEGNAFTSSVLAYTARYQPRKTAITIPGSEGALAGTYTSYASYNPDGSIAGESYPAAGGMFAEEVFHTYDDTGRPLTTYGGPDGQTVTYAASTDYTRYGEMQRLQLGTGSKRVWLSQYYDTSTRRLDRVIVDAEVPAPMQSDVHYEYDDIGNVTSIADTPLAQTADRQCFRYDHLRRLTEAWTPTGDCAADPDEAKLGGPAPYWQSFTYDLVGNRLSKVSHTATGDVTTGYTYPTAGADRPHAVSATTGVDAMRFEYDAAGNTIARGGQALTWDEGGRLAAATKDGDTTTFVYDAAGQRLLRRDPAATTLYLDSQELRLDRASGTVTATRYYTHGGATVAVRTQTGLTWVAGDHHGTAQVAIDSANLKISKRRQDPFGNPRGTQPTTWPDEKGFVGGAIDASTGLTHLGARAYDPRHGRFISVDPVVDSADPQQMNAYAYSNNNPTTMSDPDGLRYCSDDACTQWVGPDGKVHGKGAQPPAATPSAPPAPSEDEVLNEAGYSKEEYEKAKKTRKKTVLDVALDAGGQILAEFLGINDIKGCFGDGDLGSCISMVIGAIPWTKLFRIGEFVGAVKKAWKAVTGFRAAKKKADNVVEAVDEARKKLTAAGSKAKKNSGGCHSFRADTNVRMADGSRKPISKVKVGDKVLATDPMIGKTTAKRVTALHVNRDTDLTDVTVAVTGNGMPPKPGARATTVLRTTDHHPFWDRTAKVWVDAADLRVGHELRTADGQVATVIAVRSYAGVQTMHDLTVDDLHTYYVLAGSAPVLVHNNDYTVCPVHPEVFAKGKECPKCAGEAKGGGNAAGGRGQPGDADRPQAAAGYPESVTAEIVSGIADVAKAEATGDPYILAAAASATAVTAGIANGARKLGDLWRRWRHGQE
ncbi:RHS repeat-associated core domain-containing protein [Micromonospora sp. CPCC 206061]|uniref:RHS repeat-associated core domain-containing protein n=1 Tax=Micromonospora sp. CPCC 206061 TaxID=3122410 RepID=UPI002FEFE8D7